jgi:murein DD-endopeptidase MepM/ murein hydrolase activator NlpD
MKATTHFLLLLAAIVLFSLSCSLGSRLMNGADGSPTNPPAPASPAAPAAATTDLLPGTVVPPLATEALPAVETAAQQAGTEPPVSSTEAPPVVETPAQQAETALPASETEVPAPSGPPETPFIAIPLLFSRCGDETCTYAGSFLLARPVAPPGRTVIDVSDRFGSYQRRTRAANHGVSFLNSSGTPVLAAAGGVVVVAGDDSQVNYGLRPNTYGSLVVIKHELPGVSEPVFTLYAHLSQVFVNVDDPVQAGQEIGLVGMSGSVRGSTLDFEVRLGENTYASVRNPELWLAPLTDEAGGPLGTLAGRILDSQGAPLAVSNILVEQLSDSGGPAVDQVYLKTYSDRGLAGLSPWEESFAAGDLPPGSYQISFWHNNDLQQRVVEILPGQLTFVTFQIQ